MASVALQLAEWAHDHANDPEDVALADRSCIAYMGTLVRNGECSSKSYMLAEINGQSSRQGSWSSHLDWYSD